VVRWWRHGRHSNLPRCCIAYFIVRTLVVPHPVKTWWAEHVWARETRPDQHSYVRCAICALRRRWVEQHLCTEACS
jgi:hypothetical protein